MRSEKKAKLAKYQSYQTFVIRVMILAIYVPMAHIPIHTTKLACMRVFYVC